MNIKQLETNQIAETARLLAREFQSGPLASYLFPDEETRQEILTPLFEGLLTTYQSIGTTYFTAPPIEGTFSLLPSDERKGVSFFLHLLLAVPSMISTFIHLDLQETYSRFQQIKPYLEQMQETLQQQGDYLFISSIGVRPPSTEVELLAQSLPFVKEQKGSRSLIVETETQELVQLYQSHGFELLKELPIPQRDFTLYLMIYH